MNNIDIRKHPEIIEIINNALNQGEIIEVKNEARSSKRENIVVVRITRKLITEPKAK